MTRQTGAAAVLTAGLLGGMLITGDGAAEVAAEPEGGELAGRVQRLEDKTADQAHAMVSVAYHFNNLWFAGQASNWDLAQFYLNETRSHLRWSVRIIPLRKDAAGYEIKLEKILEAMENGPLTQLEAAVKAKDADAFVKAYEFSLENCYACHKASDKPYLRLRMPEQPAEPMIDFAPAEVTVPDDANNGVGRDGEAGR